MGIVVIHGAGPGSGKPNVLARQWQDALVSGLRAAGLSNAEEQDIRFAYYGDLGRDGRAAANAGPTDLQLAVAHEVLANGGVDERPECRTASRTSSPGSTTTSERTRAC